MKIEKVKIGSIKNNPNNPRVIKDDKFKKLVQSVKDFPQMLDIRPIVVNDEMIVLGGNMRLKACIEAGLKEVSIIKASELTPEQQNEFIIKDNVGFGEWNWDDLANDWDEAQLVEWGLDLPISFGEVLEAEEDDFEAPEGGIETDIVLGDLFEIGEHRLLCGDSTIVENLDKLMNGKKADMVLTDPPYNVKFGGRKRKDGFKHEVIENDDLSDNDFENFISEFMSVFLINKPNEVYIFCDWKLSLILAKHFDFKQCLCVIKNHIGMGSGYRKQTELCLYSGSFKSTEKNDILLFTKEMVYSQKYKVPIFETLHPTQKPIELISEIINNSSIEGQLILDYFVGSGSTMVASHQLKRKCYGMELDPKYCQVIIDRMKKLDPTLIIKRNGIRQS